MHDQVPQFNFNFSFDGHSDSDSNAIRTRGLYCLQRMCTQTAPTLNLLLLYFAWKNRHKYTILLIANDKDFRYSLAYRRHRRTADKLGHFIVSCDDIYSTPQSTHHISFVFIFSHFVSHKSEHCQPMRSGVLC